MLKAKIPRKSLMSFYWHLHYCLSAGLDAGQAIQAFLNRGLSTVFRRELDGILKHYQHGALLSFAFDKQTLQDRSMVISLLKAAEASGQYAQIFSGLAHYQAWKIDMTDKIARLLYYPFFLFLVGCALLGATLFILVPELQPILKEMVNQQSTRLDGIYAFVVWCQNHGLLMVGVILGPVLILGLFGFISTRMQLMMQKTLFQVPLLSTLMKYGETVQFCRVIHLLLAHDVRLIEGIKQMACTHPLAVCRHSYQKLHEDMTRGESLSQAFAKVSLFDPLFYQMLLAGEVSGNLAQAMKQASHYFDQAFKRKIDALLRLLPTLILMVVGLVLIFILSQVILPLYDTIAVSGDQI